MTGCPPSWPWTAATARPTWRWWPRTGRCWRASAGPAWTRSATGCRTPSRCSAASWPKPRPGRPWSPARAPRSPAGRPGRRAPVRLHRQRRPARGGRRVLRRAAGAGLEPQHFGGQRHLRRAAGRADRGRARRATGSRQPLGGGGDLRRRHQLRGAGAGRAVHPVPGAGRHQRRLGRRVRPGPGHAVVGGPGRGRARSADRAARSRRRSLRRSYGARGHAPDTQGPDSR